MKSSAEAELLRLDQPQTREEIEARMAQEKVSKSAANDRLPYVLVTYIRNVENLDAKRKTEVARITEDASAQVSALKSDVRSLSDRPWFEFGRDWDDETGMPPEEPPLRNLTEKAGKSQASENGVSPDAGKVPRAQPETSRETLDSEGQKNRKFIQENRSEIDRLIAKLPAGEKNQAAKILIENPKTDNIWLFQEKVLGMKGA